MLVPGFVDQMDFIPEKVEINNIMESNKSCDSVEIVVALFLNFIFFELKSIYNVVETVALNHAN